MRCGYGFIDAQRPLGKRSGFLESTIRSSQAGVSNERACLAKAGADLAVDGKGGLVVGLGVSVAVVGERQIAKPQVSARDDLARDVPVPGRLIDQAAQDSGPKTSTPLQLRPTRSPTIRMSPMQTERGSSSPLNLTSPNSSKPPDVN